MIHDPAPSSNSDPRATSLDIDTPTTLTSRRTSPSASSRYLWLWTPLTLPYGTVRLKSLRGFSSVHCRPFSPLKFPRSGSSICGSTSMLDKPSSGTSDMGAMRPTRRGGGTSWYRRRFKVFREAHGVRDLQLVLIVYVLENCSEDVVGILKEDAAAEKASWGFDDFSPVPLVTFIPTGLYGR